MNTLNNGRYFLGVLFIYLFILRTMITAAHTLFASHPRKHISSTERNCNRTTRQERLKTIE
jgi:hypothetical protein